MKKINIENIPGLESLDDNSAEMCTGGSFRVGFTRPNGRSRARRSRDGSPIQLNTRFINSLELENLDSSGPDDVGNNFTVDFRREGGQTVFSSQVSSGTGLDEDAIATAVGRGATQVVITQGPDIPIMFR